MLDYWQDNWLANLDKHESSEFIFVLAILLFQLRESANFGRLYSITVITVQGILEK